MKTPFLKKLAWWSLSIFGACLLGAAALFVAIVQPGGDGVLASLRLPDGSEYMVSQRCNWSGEPYTVAFYLRAKNGPWGWCYIDHEADRWRNVAMSYDPESDSIIVTERGKRQALLDRKRNSFWIATFSRDVQAPQSYREPDFTFPL